MEQEGDRLREERREGGREELRVSLPEGEIN